MRTVGPLLFGLVTLAIIVPSAILGLKIADGWSVRETHILLGGSLAICGALVVVVAIFIGVTFYARLSGRQAATPPQTPPQVIDGWQAWQASQQPQLQPPAQPILPSWPTGGGNFMTMDAPQPRQDGRYGFVDDIDTPKIR